MKEKRWEALLPNPRPPEAEAFAADGYIRDQDCLHAYTYRTIPASVNCCGPVAIFNLLRYSGRDAAFPEVLREMDKMHLLHVPGPTRMYVMRRYLNRYLPGWREDTGRTRCLALARDSAMGIFRYKEAGIPHFVAYYRVEDGRFRFLNVNERAEDVLFTVERFAQRHCVGDPVRLLYWENAALP